LCNHVRTFTALQTLPHKRSRRIERCDRACRGIQNDGAILIRDGS